MSNEVRVENVSVSDIGLALIVMEGQVAESERYLATLNRRRARIAAEMAEVEAHIRQTQEGIDRQRSRINGALQAAQEANKPTYRF